MKRGSGPERQSFKRGLEYLRGLEYIPQSHIDFFEHITKTHRKAKDCIVKDKIYPSITKKAAGEMLRQGFPLVNFDRMRVKIRPLRSHFAALCKVLGRFEQTKASQIDAFLKSNEYKKLDLKQLIKKIISHDTGYLNTLSERTAIDENTLKLLAIAVAKPLFEVAAGELKERLKDDFWWRNYCPMCGSEPFMARIQRGDKYRILKCSLCGWEWRFDRVRCSFCSNEDQKSMRFFFYHEASPHRLYVCDKCKRYIKCIDETKTADQPEAFDLSIEDMATLYLDVLAKEKGYVSSWVSKP